MRSYHRGIAARPTNDPAASKPVPTGLIERYVASSEFKSKASSIWKKCKRYRDMIDKELGSMPIEVLDDKRVRGDFKDWRDGMASKPRETGYA